MILIHEIACYQRRKLRMRERNLGSVKDELDEGENESGSEIRRREKKRQKEQGREQ